MKTKYTTHIKYDSCWYDKFFKQNQQQLNHTKIRRAVSLNEIKNKENEHTKK